MNTRKYLATQYAYKSFLVKAWNPKAMSYDSYFIRAVDSGHAAARAFRLCVKRGTMLHDVAVKQGLNPYTKQWPKGLI